MNALQVNKLKAHMFDNIACISFVKADDDAETRCQNILAFTREVKNIEHMDIDDIVSMYVDEFIETDGANKDNVYSLISHQICYSMFVTHILTAEQFSRIDRAFFHKER